MRDLSSAEYRTVLAILSQPRATERQRIRASGLPSSTYNVVRRRAFGEGWLSDLVVPNPGPCGFAGVAFVLARPYGSAREELVRGWARDPECVLLWSGVHAVFGIFFRHAPDGSPRGAPSAPEDPNEFWVRVETSVGAIPAYFDYSGLWGRFGGQPSLAAYPAGLITAAVPTSRRALVEARQLVDSSRAETDAPGRWTNLFHLARTHPHALDLGTVQSRTVLHPAKLPPYEGRRIAEVIFIRGEIRPAATAASLLNVLTQECGVYPFLLAESRGRVILAGLGQTSARDPGRVLVPSASRPVLPSITRHLDPADVLIEPVEAIEERVQHRYPVRFPALGRESNSPSTHRADRLPRR